MKTLLRALLLCLLTIALVLCAAQAEELVVADASSHIYQAGGMPGTTLVSRSADMAKLKALFATSLTNFEVDVDVSEYKVDRDTLMDLFTETINDHPEFFYVSGRIGFYGSDPSNVPKVHFYYANTQEEAATMLKAYRAEISRAVSYASQGSTPLMKAMLVSDYFALNYHYDTTYTYRDAYSLFTRKTGVCQGYMLGYCAVLQALGIPVETVSSDPMNHTWNLVQIDGQWYHVDVTWNDPVPDTAGKAYHNYLFRSDAGFQNNAYGNAHYSWVADNGIKATSTKYDNAEWCGFSAPLSVRGDQLFYSSNDDEKVYLNSWRNGTSTVLHSFDCVWIITTPEQMNWQYNGTNFGSVGLYGDYLLYTTYNTAEALSLKDGSVRVLYTAPAKLGIWSSSFNGNVMTYALGQDYNVITERGSITLYLKDLIEAILPDDLTVIEANAFAGTAVERVVAGTKLERIESNAFANCPSLAEIVLGSSVTSIASDAFSGCNVITFVCPEGSVAAAYAAANGFNVIYQ